MDPISNSMISYYEESNAIKQKESQSDCAEKVILLRRYNLYVNVLKNLKISDQSVAMFFANESISQKDFFNSSIAVDLSKFVYVRSKKNESLKEFYSRVLEFNYSFPRKIVDHIILSSKCSKLILDYTKVDKHAEEVSITPLLHDLRTEQLIKGILYRENKYLIHHIGHYKKLVKFLTSHSKMFDLAGQSKLLASQLAIEPGIPLYSSCLIYALDRFAETKKLGGQIDEVHSFGKMIIPSLEHPLPGNFLYKTISQVNNIKKSQFDNQIIELMNKVFFAYSNIGVMLAGWKQEDQNNYCYFRVLPKELIYEIAKLRALLSLPQS